MSTQTTLLISSDFSYHHWDHHYFPLHLKQPPVETECRVDSRIFFTLLFFFLLSASFWQSVPSESRTPQLDWNILFTGLFVVTGGLIDSGIKGAPNVSGQMRDDFP